MSLERIFKASLLFLTLVVLFYLDIETGVLYFSLSLGMLAYTAYRYILYRNSLRKQPESTILLQSYNWVPALLMWFVIAAMVVKDEDGLLVYVSAALLLIIGVLTALRESTKAYVVGRTGIQDLKSSKFIAAEDIVEIVNSEDVITVRTKRLEDQLTIRKLKLKSPDFEQAIVLLTSFPKVLKQV